MPTEQCNFRCTYCYEDFEIGRMSEETVRRIEQLLTLRAPDLDAVSIAWFGGEPTLALDIVQRIQRRVLDLVREHPQLRADASMTTNAYRLDAGTFRWMVRLGVRDYQITLDGPPDVHDGLRLRQGGQGSFARIWRNLESARDSDGEFSILLRLHVSRASEGRIDELLDRVEDAFGSDPRFRVFLRPVRHGDGPCGSGSIGLDARTAAKVWEEGPRRVASRGLNAPASSDQVSACYAARLNSFVVRADGTLGKCTVALSHPNNAIGRLTADGAMELDLVKFAGWIRGVQSGDPAQLGCPMNGFADRPAETVRGLVNL